MSFLSIIIIEAKDINFLPLRSPNNTYFCFENITCLYISSLGAVKKMLKVDMRSLLYVFTLLLPTNSCVRTFTIPCFYICVCRNFSEMRYVQCYNKNCNKISLRLSFSGGSFLNTLIPFLAFAMKLVCVEITGCALLLSFHWHRKFFSTFITPWVINVFCENCKLMQTVEAGKEDKNPLSQQHNFD